MVVGMYLLSIAIIKRRKCFLSDFTELSITTVSHRVRHQRFGICYMVYVSICRSIVVNVFVYHSTLYVASNFNKDRIAQLALMCSMEIYGDIFFYCHVSWLKAKRQRQTVDSSSVKRKRTITLNAKEICRHGYASAPSLLMQNIFLMILYIFFFL